MASRPDTFPRRHQPYAVRRKNGLDTFIDTRLIETDPAGYARTNKAMIGSYHRAIRKEVGREDLLKWRLGPKEVRHYVVSRFPVLDDAADIIAFVKLAVVAGAL